MSPTHLGAVITAQYGPIQRRQVNAAVEPDPHLGAVITAQYGPILQQGHPEAKTGGGHGGRGSGNAAADDYQVVAPAVFGRFRQSERLAAERSQRRRLIGRREVEVAGEKEGITASLEAGQIMQGNFRLAANLHCAAILPMPGSALGAEGGAERLAVDQHLEPARRPRRLPGGDPVPRAHPDPVLAGSRKPHSSLRVAHGLAQPVGQQVGRPHLVHELLVHQPPAEVGELLALDQDNGRLGNRAGGENAK